jgi:DNA-binding transcriptional regulator YiaG
VNEAIRKRRLELELRQIDVATIIGCDEATVVNWEKGHASACRLAA